MAGPWENYQSQASGPWQRYGTQVKQPPPGYGTLGPKAEADLQQTQLNVQKTAGTLAADETSAKNAAVSSGIKAKSDQIDFNIKSGIIPGNPALKGEAYLASLPPGMADMVRAYDEGRMGVSLNMRSPQMMQIAGAINHYDPSFDAVKYNTRLAAMKSGATGRLGSSDNALNTAVVHAGNLWDQSLGTAGNDTGIGPISLGVNAFQNWMHKGSPGLVTYNDTAGKLAGEEAQAYGMGTQGERDNLLQHFDPNMPEESKKAAIKNAMDLFASKMAANLHQYQWGNMGNQKPSLDLLDPEARATLQRIAPEVLAKHFSGEPDPMAQALGVSSVKGSRPPPPPPPGFTPPPTGPTGGVPNPSSNGYDETADPQSAAFWDNAVRQGTPYRQALQQWQSQLGGKSVVSPPDPDLYAKSVAYARKYPNAEYNPVESFTRTPIGPVQAVTNAIAQNPGGAFGTHYGNAALANIPTLLAGDRGAMFNAVSHEQNPKASSLGDLMGTVAGMATAGKAVGAVAPSLGKMGQFLTSTPLRQGLAGDVAYGTTAGGAGNPDHPVLGATLGGLSAAGGNAAGRYILGPALRAAGDSAPVQRAISLFRSPDAPFSPPSPLNSGQSTVLGQANKSGIDDITGKLTQAHDLGLPYALADADPRLRMLAGSAVRKSPDVRSLAESVLTPRQAGQGERAIQQIGNNLAPVGDVPTMQADVLKSAQSQSGPLYNAAKAQPVPELTANPALKEVLDRPAAQSAVRSGYNTALNNGEDVGSLTYATDPNGNPVQYGNPSWNVIHYARQELDKSGETAVRRALDKQIAGLNPGFKEADAKYAGIMKGSDALQAGADATGIRVTPEATQNALAGFPNNGSQFQQGYASNMADQIERQRFTGNPYNLVNGSMGQQAKLGTVFPNGAARFGNAQALESDMGKTYQEALGGSPTQPRAEADKLFSAGDAAEAGMDLAGVAATGGSPLGLLPGLLVRKGTDFAKLGMGRAKADAVGPMLLNTDPQTNMMTLGDLVRMGAARQRYVNQARSLGGLIGAPISFGLTQNN